MHDNAVVIHYELYSHQPMIHLLGSTDAHLYSIHWSEIVLSLFEILQGLSLITLADVHFLVRELDEGHYLIFVYDIPLVCHFVELFALQTLKLFFHDLFDEVLKDVLVSELLSHWYIAAEIFVSDLQDVLLIELLTHWHITAEIFVSDLQDVLLSELLTHWHIAAEIFVSDLQDVLLFENLTHCHIATEIFVSDLQDVLLSELVSLAHRC